MISKFDIERLQVIPIEQVATALGLSVERHKALCPFHDDSHPSLTFSVRRNRYRCFVCGASGGPIDLVMHYEHKSFLEACQWLADKHSVILSTEIPSSLNSQPSTFKEPEKPFDASRYERFFARPWLSEEAKRFLFTERHLDARVIRWCRLTSWRDKQGIPWLQVPYYDVEGNLTGVQFRNLDYGSKFKVQGSKDDVPQPSSLTPQPRFRFPKGSKCNIYNLQILKRLSPGETLFIAEGCSDCWSLLSSGHKAIAIPSATLLSRKDEKVLGDLAYERGTVFHIFPDQDAAGEQLYERLLQVSVRYSFTLVRHQLPMGCKDFSEMYLLKGLGARG